MVHHRKRLKMRSLLTLLSGQTGPSMSLFSEFQNSLPIAATFCALFEFSEPLGAAYTGAWRNGFTFEIVIADAANASLGVRSDRFVGSEVTTHLWAVPGSATSQAVARGDFRETIGAPPLGLRLGLGLGLG